jgi:hypothetical protein
MIPFIGGQLWKYVAAGAAALTLMAVTAVGVQTWRLGRAQSAVEAAEDRLRVYQSAAAAVITERLRAQETQARVNEEKARESVASYQARVAELRARHERALARLRDQSATASAGSGVPTAPSGPAGTDGAPDGDAATRFLGDLRACEEAREQLKALQEWIRSTH